MGHCVQVAKTMELAGNVAVRGRLLERAKKGQHRTTVEGVEDHSRIARWTTCRLTVGYLGKVSLSRV